jgi:hypothetical protein
MATYVNPGLDASGNNNTWTTNNINWTGSGSTFDTMTDVPTNTNTNTANYCVMSPINTQSGITVSDGNLALTATGNTNSQNSQASFGISSGKWYFENTVVAQSGANQSLWGFINQGTSTTTNPGSSNGIVCGCVGSAYATMSGSTVANAIGASFTTNDVAMVAIDVDAGKLWFGKNGTWLGSSSPNPATGTSPNITFTAGTPINPVWQGYESLNKGAMNFGQRPFTYTPPSGFVALNTFNLPTPTIGATASTQANKYFDATLYTGTGSALTVTNAGGFQPSFVWVKNRSAGDSSGLYDAIRGVNQRLISNSTGAEDTSSGVSAFNSNGFSLGTAANYNTNGNAFVGWQWNGGTSTVTNTSGSISSQVRANTTAGFSVVTYTGTGSAATVGHGLGVALKMLIVKNRVQGTYGNWNVWHTAITGSQYLSLNLTDAVSTNNNRWNGTIPTSTVFSLGADSFGNTNKSGDTYVAYCFSEVAGYSKFGSYTGNGSADGPFLYFGFRPAFIMFKRTSSAVDWTIYDNKRIGYNPNNYKLRPNVSDAEYSTPGFFEADIVSNGFKIRTSDAEVNTSGQTYIFMAFAESPFNYSNAR